MAFRGKNDEGDEMMTEDPQKQQQQQKAAEERRQQEEDSKRAFLTQVMDQAALARLNTFKLARPDKGSAVEEMLMRMAAMGQIGPRASGNKISEPELIQVLEKISEQTQKKTTVKFDRRRNALDDDD